MHLRRRSVAVSLGCHRATCKVLFDLADEGWVLDAGRGSYIAVVAQGSMAFNGPVAESAEFTTDVNGWATVSHAFSAPGTYLAFASAGGAEANIDVIIEATRLKFLRRPRRLCLQPMHPRLGTTEAGQYGGQTPSESSAIRTATTNATALAAENNFNARSSSLTPGFEIVGALVGLALVALFMVHKRYR